MWIYFNQQGIELKQLTHGTALRQGAYGLGVEVVCMWEDADIYNSFSYASIAFKRPDGINIGIDYGMDKTQRTFELIEDAGETPSNVLPFVNGQTYFGFAFTFEDPAILCQYGTYFATITLYSATGAKKNTQVSFVVEREVYDGSDKISTTQYAELMERIAELGYDRIFVLNDIDEDINIDNYTVYNNQVVFEKSSTSFFNVTCSYDEETSEVSIEKELIADLNLEDYHEGLGILINHETNVISVNTATIQKKLTAGTNITIDDDGVISATSEETYTAGNGITIDSQNVISADITQGNANGYIKVGVNNIKVYDDSAIVAIAEGKVKSLTVSSAFDLTKVKQYINDYDYPCYDADGNDITSSVLSDDGTIYGIINPSFALTSDYLTTSSNSYIVVQIYTGIPPAYFKFVFYKTDTDLNNGDIILVKETEEFDWWYDEASTRFYHFEMKVDLSGYATIGYVDTGLAAKVSRSDTTSGSYLYGIGAGVDKMYNIHKQPGANGIVQRTGNGNIVVPLDPAANDCATSKSYVDIHLESKANKIEKPSSGYRVYVATSSDDNTYITATEDLTPAGAIVKRNSGGRAQINDPNVGYDIANKRYVDFHHDSTKQDALVSGTNIKTINNESLLSSGNVDLVKHTTKTDGNYIYGSENGVDKDYYIARLSYLEGSIAQRTTGGALFVGAPTADNHAATKKYVDTQVANMNGATVGYATLDKSKLGYSTDGGTRPTQRTYTAMSSGNDAYLTYEKIGSILKVTIMYEKGSEIASDSAIRISYADILSALSVSGTVNSNYTSVNGCSRRNSTVGGPASVVTYSDSTYIYVCEDGGADDGFDVALTLVVS